MRILAVGVHYTNAPLSVRERLAVSGHDLNRALQSLKPRVREGLILSTCNRTEVYAVLGPNAPAHLLHDFLAEWGGLPGTQVRDLAHQREDRDAVSHALRVASGLDSMVLGEDQIQAQVKRSLAVARENRALGPALERLGAAALTCGKRVRTLTKLGRHSVSLESLAVRAATHRFGSLRDRDIVILGAGDVGRLVARHLRHAGALRITVTSRSLDRAGDVARAADAVARPLAELADALTTADVVFCCTSAPHPVLTTDWLAHRLAMRAGAPLLCMDLGMPRDVDPAVATLPGVEVVTLDALADVAAAHRADRLAEVPAAEKIVAGETARYLDWLTSRTVGNGRNAAGDRYTMPTAPND